MTYWQETVLHTDVHYRANTICITPDFNTDNGIKTAQAKPRH